MTSFATIETGVVEFYDNRSDRTFGKFITAKGENIFFHLNQRDEKYEPYRLPKQGDRVEFVRVNADNRGPKASRWWFDPYVSYPEICCNRLGVTSQEGAYYVGGTAPYPDLSKGIRFDGERRVYASLRIHREDVERFVNRFKKWERGALIPTNLLIYIDSATGVFFFSSCWEQPGIPEGFKTMPLSIPMVVDPCDEVPDGIIASTNEVVRYFLEDLREIPNPNPEHQPK